MHAAGAAQRVYMVTDSVGLGAKNAVPAAFPAGWQVTRRRNAGAVRRAVGEQARQNPDGHRPRRCSATTPSSPAATTTRTGTPTGSTESIDSIIAALLEQAGVKHIFWVTLREVKPEFISASAWNQVQPYYWYFPTVNDHLRAAVARHPDLSLIDWAAIADRPGLTYDAIHLNTFGASEYAAQHRPGGHVGRHATAGRIDDDRQGGGSRRRPGRCQAVSLNLTMTDPRAPGFLTAYRVRRAPPAGQQRQLHQRQHGGRGGDRAGCRRRHGVRVHQRGHHIWSST